MNTTYFSSRKAKELLDDNRIEECKEYVKKHVFPVRGGYMIRTPDNDHLNMVSATNISDFVTSDISNDDYIVEHSHRIKFNKKDKFNLFKFIKGADFRDMSNFCNVDIDYDKPPIFTRQTKNGQTQRVLNMARQLPHNYQKPTKKALKKQAENLKLFFNHLRKVWCSDNEDQYNYAKNWISHTVAGKKLRVALYLKSAERTGKGIITNGIAKMLGEQFYRTSSTEKLTKYTKELEGRLLIVIDELKGDSGGIFSVTDTLKGLITEPVFDCRNMYENGYIQKNTFNLLITTNNQAIALTQINNARYVCIDVSEEYIGQHDYFKKLASIFNSTEFLQCLYYKLLNIYEETKDFNFDTIPESKARSENITQSLPIVHKYIKTNYILNSIDLKESTKAFNHDLRESTKRKISDIEIGRQMKQIGIQKKKVNNCWHWVASHELMLNIFRNKKWIIEEYEHIEENNDDENGFLDYESMYNSVYDSEKKKDERIKKLEEQIAQLQKLHDAKQIVPTAKEKKNTPKKKIIKKKTPKKKTNKIKADELITCFE